MLAGYPFHISPSELWEMSSEELDYWLELADLRTKSENKQ
ncbi:MAG: GpE family phage tail protein [Desulfobacterales bacterium]|nr:GpE family phage tail protein [Desulfobacterales bacterium]